MRSLGDQPSRRFGALRIGMRALNAGRDDRALARRVLERGDEGAFRELYRRHTPYLFPFVLRVLGGDEQEAEDVVQETWIRAVEKLATFRWEAALRTWLCGIALNLCRALFRRRDERWLDAGAAAEPVAHQPSAERIDLERALARLPDGYRAVLVLHDVEGFKHEEIAAALGTTAGTSKSQLHHARRAVRAMLDTGSGLERR
jgi:RNA polymerase sigma-70 factor (ECF subfamily)